MPADSGIRFGPYVLLRRIARGGMAEVFLAQQRGLEGFDRRVAVKRILPHLADTPDFIQMFLGEARLAAQLTHPNIVHIYDFGRVEGDYFIAMEYVEGIHTGQVFRPGEPAAMSPTLVARIGANAAAALNYAHELLGPTGQPLGLVHRDVSPANIMVSYDGIVKLCDFGIAKAMSASDQLTNPGQVKGKYAYMSPEQTIASQLDGRSDVFSLSIVLSELLAGKHLVPRGDAVDAMRMIRDGRLPRVEVVAPHTPPALAEAINRGLETKRELRPTASELAQALETFIKASPELATPMQLAQWVRKRFPRDVSGQHPSLASSAPDGTAIAPGTAVAPDTPLTPKTAVAPHTVAGQPTAIGAATEIARRSAGMSETSDTLDDETQALPQLAGDLGLSGVTEDERANASVLDGLARDLAHQQNKAPLEDRPTIVAEAAGITVEDDPSVRAADESTLRERRDAPSFPDIGLDTETNVLGGFRPSAGSGPQAVSAERIARPTTPRPDAHRLPPAARKYVVPGVVLLGIAISSFLIALAARSCSHQAAVPIDAETTGSGVVIAPVVDAPVPMLDAATAIDAGVDADDHRPTALLTLRTHPEGGTIKIGDQVRTAPTEFALHDGTYVVTAEHDGYRPERREVVLERDERVVIEIPFTHRLPKKQPPHPPRRPKPGRLIVYTTPYSDVYKGTRKLGQTPFDIQIAPGTYTLLFKNPQHRTVSRTVKVMSGRPTRLKFDLPK